ncbi:MAG: RdgB/HAM1 family non-canonical purine NTP pyrophosphatase [Anaerolineae bacterium]
MKQLLVATGNQGKVRDFAELLADLNIDWIGQNDTGFEMDVEETGSTFTENAILKATQWSKLTGHIALADDSGLEVDALGGAPGLYTARYGTPEMTHEERYLFLLKNLEHVAEADRTAQFRCVIAVTDGNGEVLKTVEGICPGRISFEPKGTHGFGYDPIFIPDGFDGKTMAEVPSSDKQLISHRGRAIANLHPFLKSIL